MEAYRNSMALLGLTYDSGNSGFGFKLIQSIAIDELGNVWFSTYVGGFVILNASSLENPRNRQSYSWKSILR